MCGGGGGPDPIEYTPEMEELARIGVEQYNLSKDFEYLKDDLEDRVDALDTQGAEDFVQGKANLGSQKAYASAIKSAKRNQFQGGIDPSSGRSIGLDTEMYGSSGKSNSESMNNAAFEKNSQALTGQQNVINIGLGKAGKAQMGLNDIAEQSVNAAIGDAYDDFNEHAATSQAVGTAAGLGVSAYNNTK